MSEATMVGQKNSNFTLFVKKNFSIYLTTFLGFVTLLLVDHYIYDYTANHLDWDFSADFPSTARYLTSNDDAAAAAAFKNPNDTYSPGIFVKYGHKLTGSTLSLNQSYIQRALYSPIVIFGLGFLAMISLNLGLLFRCCCEPCRCLPDLGDEKYERKLLVNTVFFYIFCVFVLLFDQLVFIGNTNLTTGINDMKNAINNLQSIIILLKANAASLVGYGTSLTSDYSSLESSCSQYKTTLTSYSSYLTTYTDAAASFSSNVSPLSSRLNTVLDYLNEYGIYYRQLGIYVIWGLSIFLILAFFLPAKLLQHEGLMKVGVSLAIIVYYLYLILGIAWVAITEIGADLCMNPTYTIIHNLPGSSAASSSSSFNLKNIAQYYATCVGNSTLQTSVDKGSAGIATLNSSLAILYQTSCANNTYLHAINSDITKIEATFTSVHVNLQCAPIQKEWFAIVNDGFCTQLYQGVFYIWGSQLVTSFCLFVLIWISVMTWQYFDNGKIVPSSGNDDDGGEADEGQQQGGDRGGQRGSQGGEGQGEGDEEEAIVGNNARGGNKKGQQREQQVAQEEDSGEDVSYNGKVF